MSSSTLQVADLAGASQHIPADQPVVMLNLVHFRPQAQYATDSGFSPCSGQEAYIIRYREAFQAITASLAKTVSVIYLGQTHGSLLAGEDAKEEWDMLIIVKYENFAAFREILESEAYTKEAKPHQVAALDKWKFIATTEIGA